MNNICYFCNSPLPRFIITPILETDEGILEVCEPCSDKNLEGWKEDDDENIKETK